MKIIDKTRIANKLISADTPTQLIFFTDLDDTLLDARDYGFEPARSIMGELEARNIPLILLTSKSAAEVFALRDAMGNRHPFGTENGSVIFIPQGYFNAVGVEKPAAATDYEIRRVGLDYETICAMLHRLRDQKGYQFRGFSDMSVAEVIEITGLTQVQAQEAKQRESTEAILWQDSTENLREFEIWLKSQELTLLSGGRFLHVMPAQADKALAMNFLMQSYRSMFPDKIWKTIAFGDGGNDLRMLEAADVGIVVPHVNGYHIQVQNPCRIECDEIASHGWVKAAEWILGLTTGAHKNG